MFDLYGPQQVVDDSLDTRVHAVTDLAGLVAPHRLGAALQQMHRVPSAGVDGDRPLDILRTSEVLLGPPGKLGDLFDLAVGQAW